MACYLELLPDATIVDVDTDHEPFCLAACRNQAVRIAEAGGYDVVVLADADTLPEREPLLAAIEAAAGDTRVHLPYNQYRSLREDGTRQYLTGTPLERCNHLVVDGACSGVYVTTPATWWAHGGQDERFLGWGGEDAAWYAAHKAILGAEPIRHTGRVFALHHHSQVKEGGQYTANFALVYRYLQAEQNPEAMRTLIAEAEHATSPVA
jgi:predicted glycosyltransferase involved in capsule biosynthesis